MPNRLLLYADALTAVRASQVGVDPASRLLSALLAAVGETTA